MKIIISLIVIISVVKLSESSELNKKAVSIANNTFKKYLLTAVVWEHCDMEIITNFLKLYEGLVVTIAIKEFDLNNTGFPSNISYKQTVFCATKPAEFEYFIKMINRVIVVPIKVILVIANSALSSHFCSEFTKVAWENDVGDIVIVGYDTNNKVSLKTYFPYENGICGDYTSVSLDLNTTQYFREKYRNFNGCPIRVTLLEHVPYLKLKKENGTVVSIDGMDGILLKLIVGALNASLDIVSSVDHGGISSCVNGTRIGSFNELVYNMADIMAPSFIIVSIRYVRSQISYVYYTVRVVWCVPNRREIYEWAKAILPFVNNSTPIIISTIIVLNVIIRLIRKVGKLNEKSVGGSLFELVGIFLGQQVKINSKYRLTKCLLIFWIWFGLIVRISYQGKLIHGLRKTFLEPPIKTLAEAMEVVDELGGMPTFIELYRNTSIEKKYNQIKLSEISTYLKEMAAGKRYLLAVDMTQLIYFRQKLQILEERVTSVPACIHMRARWPAAPGISRLISRIVETGFLHKIYKQKKSIWTQQNKTSLTNTAEPLDLEILSSCFYGLVIMYCICFLVLCLEIISNYYEKPKIKKRLRFKK